MKPNPFCIHVLIIGLALLALVFPITKAQGSYFSSKSGQSDAPSTISPVILFQDDFNDGNADGWAVSGDGSWYVSNGQYIVDMGTGYFIGGNSFAGDSNWANYIYEVDVMSEDGGDKGIVFRCVNVSGSCYFVNLQGGGLNKILLGKPDLPAALVTADFPTTSGVWYHVKIILLGSHIKVSVDGQPLIDYIAGGSNLVTHGPIGAAGWTGAFGHDIVRFDNVIVYSAFSYYLPVLVN